MSENLASSEPGALGSAFRLRFVSLPARIIISVFSAALVTGVAVTLISTRSTETFLRSKIDERFPAALRSAANTLEPWYRQRELDIATFGSSEILADCLAGSGPTAEAERYLAYVQNGFPLYQSLFVLDAAGETRVSVGEAPTLALRRLRELSEVEGPEVSDVIADGPETFQLLSAPLLRDGARLGSLHAVIPVASLVSLLGEIEDLESTALYVVGRSSRVLASSPGAPRRDRLERPLPEPGAAPVLDDYTTHDGERYVGSALPFDRFGWTLVVEQDYDVAFAPVVGATGQVLAINLGIVVAFGLLAFMIARSITRPIGALSDTAHRIAQGETEIEIPRVQGHDEIAVLSRALHGMVDRLRRNQVELQRKREQIERANAELTRANEDLHRNNEVLEQLSFTDGLTQLHNHRYFQDRLRIEAKRCDLSDESLALLLLDIDDFKLLNDRYGHAVGDQVLRRVGTMLNNSVRETDLPARYGGEEFAVLAPRTSATGAVSLGEKLRDVVSRAGFRGIELPGGSEGLRVTVSVGVALYDGDVKRLFNDADRALYRAKGEGKDCVILYQDDEP